MEQSYRKILQKNIVLFRQDMVQVKEVALYLWGEEILSDSMKDDILSHATEKDRASALHTLMPKRGQDAFDVYYRALRHTQNHDLADVLEPHIAVENRIERNSATVGGGGAFGQASVIKQPEQIAEDEPDLPKCWPDVDANPLVVTVKKCYVNDSTMKKLFNNDIEVYSMTGRTTGVRVLIINNKTFNAKSQDTQKTLLEREGTDIDATALDILFRQLGYQYITTVNNRNGQGIISAIKEEAGKCKVTDNAFICVILSHGTIGSVYGVDGVPVKLKTLYDQVNRENCPNLAEKPKIFLIQACQGDKKDAAGGDAMLDDAEELNKQLTGLNIEKQADSAVDASTMADILVSTATTEGYVSWPKWKNCSCFIQALVYVIQNYADKCDLLTILKTTNRLIGNQATQTEGYKQYAEKQSTLRKKFYFFPGFEESESIFG